MNRPPTITMFTAWAALNGGGRRLVGKSTEPIVATGLVEQKIAPDQTTEDRTDFGTLVDGNGRTA